MKYLIIIILTFSFACSYAEPPILNIYNWSDDIPAPVLRDFEKETGIHVNHLSFDSNETMLAKLQSSRKPQFDIIEPTNFYLNLLKKRHLIERLDINKLKGIDAIPNIFRTENASDYGLPFYYGATGLILNTHFHNPNKIRRWRDLWLPEYKHTLLMLNEPREVFSVAFLSLGIDPNTIKESDLEKAYTSLENLFPNVRLFNSDAHVTLYIDEDITLGMIWNVDAARAIAENPALHFFLPEEGFVMYVDNYAILKHAPHRNNAYRFLNYLLRPEVAARISRLTGYAVTNKAATALLPEKIKNNHIVYLDEKTLKRGRLQEAIPFDAMKRYEKYWQKLKLSH